MERTRGLFFRRLQLAVTFATVAGIAVNLFVLWLDSRHELELEVEALESLLIASTQQVNKVLDEVEGSLRQKPGQVLLHGEGGRESFYWAAYRWEPASKGWVWPANFSFPWETLPWPQEGDAWCFVSPQGRAGQELVAYLKAGTGGRQALLLDLPGLLLASGLGAGPANPLFLAVKVPGLEAHLFSCSPGGPGERTWVCFVAEPESLGSLRHLTWDSPRVSLSGGTLLTGRLRVASAPVTVGLWVPNRGFQGTVSPAWFVLFLLALLTLGGGVALVRALKTAERTHAQGQLAMARREAELAAQWAESQWRLLLHGVREPMLFLRGELVVRANEEAVKLLKFSQAGDVIGKGLADLLPKGEQERVLKLLPTALSTGGDFTTHMVGGKGASRTVRVRPWKLEVGEESLVCLSLADYTGREKAENAFRALVTHIPEGVALLDRAGRVLWANQALAQALGLRQEDLQRASLLPFVAPPARRSAQRALARARKGREQSLSLRCRLAGAVWATVHLTLSPIQEADEVLLVAIPERAGQETEQALSMVQEVVNQHVHRCANILQGLLAQPPKGPGASAAWKQAVSQLVVPLHRLATLFSSRAQELVPVELNSLVKETVEALAGRVNQGLRLLPRPWPQAIWASARPELLRFFLEEAIQASLRCLGESIGTLEVAVERLPNRMVRLAVADTGEVLGDGSGEKAAGAFGGGKNSSGHPAWPVPARGARGAQGHGGWAGLWPAPRIEDARLQSRALAWAVARALQGQAGFRERPGFGFRLWLDLAPAQEGALPETPAPGLRAGQILVVEDEQEIRQTLAEALRQRGYQVLEAADGRQALSVYRKNASTIALVVLDLVLPELDGRRVYEELAKLPNPPAVLLSTGYVPDSDPLLARLPRLLKPFSLETFLQEVEKRVKPTAA